MAEVLVWAAIGQSMAIGAAVASAFGVLTTICVAAISLRRGRPSERQRSRQAAMWAAEQYGKGGRV